MPKGIFTTPVTDEEMAAREQQVADDAAQRAQAEADFVKGHAERRAKEAADYEQAKAETAKLLETGDDAAEQEEQPQ